MKRFYNVALVLFVLAAFTACSSSDKTTQNIIDNRPEFMKKPPQDTGEFLFETGTGSSARMAVAEEKAMIDAAAKMARKMEQRVDAMQKSFTDEVSTGAESNYSESFSSVKKTITSAKLSGLAQVESKALPDPQTGGYLYYVLVRYPVGQAAEMLNNALSREQELYIKFKESKAFKELQDEIERYKNDN